MISNNLRLVRDRIASALERSETPGRHVTVVAVTKTFGADVVCDVLAAGVEDIGENRIQEFLAKSAEVNVPCRWHLIGPLQRNKATKAIGRFHLVHSIDSVSIAQTLDRLGRDRGVVTRALLQVNTSSESSKHGVSPDAAVDIAPEIAALDAIELVGLMTIGPLTMEPHGTRRCFQALLQLRDRVSRETGLPLPELSMGMSGDFEIAIEEGATIVRLGRVLTGERG